MGLGLLFPTIATAAFDRGWSANLLARVTATEPARTFGLYPRKGVIRVGSDADVLIVDPSHMQPISAIPSYSSADHCIYEGMPGLYLRAVFSRGRLLARDGDYVGPHGGGTFVPGTLSTRDGATLPV